MDDSPLTRESLTDKAYARLSRDLKAGRLLPGAKLKLRDLAADMGISPTPVREALARLISEQALDEGHQSVCVPIIDEERLTEILELRKILEGRAAERAAAYATAKDVRRLEQLHEQLAAQLNTGALSEALVTDESFHTEVYTIARMPVLQRMIEGLWLQCGPLMDAWKTQPMPRSRRQHPHHQVLRGLRKSDGDTARIGIEEDIERTMAPLFLSVRHREPNSAAQSGVMPRVESSLVI